MDLLEHPELKSTYDKCKYTIKLWEHNFKKAHGRVPSKLDIREADRKVRAAYREYYHLKTAALEQSFKDVDGFYSDDENTENSAKPAQDKPEVDNTEAKEQPNDDVWGLHLDKKVKPVDDLKTDLNSSVTKKLFSSSKLSKRYLRKSRSFSQKKSETSFDSSQPSQSFFANLSQSSQTFSEKFTSQSSQSLIEDEEQHLSFEGLFAKSNVKIVSATERISAQSTNIVQSVLENKHKPLRTVDSGWLERVGVSSGVVFDKSAKFVPSDDYQDTDMHLNYDSDDIIDNSEEENSVNLGHPAKKAKIDVEILRPQHSEPQNQNVEVSSFEAETKTIIVKEKNNVILDTIKDKEKSEVLIQSTAENSFEFKKEIVTKSKKTKTKTVAKSRKKKNGALKTINEEDKPPRVSNRTTKNRKSLVESHSEDEDPFHSDNDDKDPEFMLEQPKNKFEGIAESSEDVPAPPKSKKSKTKKVIQQKENNEPEETDVPYELEYSIRPRVSTPRFKNLKKLITIESNTKDKNEENSETVVEVKTKRQQQKEKLEKKIESGSLNENFITINLKKKIYCRGKKNMNFSKYKKQQWKNKKKALAGPDMDMGGCDGGMLTCFNCGNTGHFAQNCTKTNGDKLLPLQVDEEPCPFPTLEEASKMAQESAFSIRKSNRHIGKSTESGVESENLDNSDDDIFDDGETDFMLAETLKLEKDVAKLDLQVYMDQVTSVDSYYKTNEDGSLIKTPHEVFDALKKFGHSAFRPGQEEAIMRILSGKSTLVTLSTGSGKSLCYQLPAFLYTKRDPCIALIISPLVSLMEDQVTGIPLFLKAACLHTNQTKVQRQKVLEAISSGLLNILLVSPEAVVAGEKQSGFGSLLRKLPPIAFACIDEAHCVSQWSHNFRPSYLMICRVLRERMGVKVVLGLTATATRSTSDSIINHLQIPDGRAGIISDVPLPDNLQLSVSKDYQRDQALLALLSSQRFVDCKSVIIYCTRREECNRVTKFLRTSLQYQEAPATNKKRKRVNVQAEAYHAGLAASKRRTIQKAFMSGELRIVVATVAFGMGINKSDIRAVLHYNMPKNFESYVQEIGRAGRDGLPAHCHLFLDAKGNDENELRRHIYANSIDRHVIRKLLQKIFLPCSCKEICPKHEVAFSIEKTVRELDIPEENISTLLCYLELHEKNYIQLLSPAYTVCKIISYGGPIQIRKAAKECPPLAMALALQKDKEENQQNVVEFAVVDIAAAIGWDSGICKHKLKNLEWTSVNGQPKRSMLNVSFSNLGFRLLAPGNLDDDQLDEALDSLYDHVVNQEKTSLLQLRAVHQTLVEVAATSYKSCLSQEPTESSNKLKSKIRVYFESPNPLDGITLTENKLIDEEQVVNNIRGLINTYRDNNFTGRAIARIFHGIMSPNYPAVIWGRCKYWRCHINVDFHTICKLATREILNFK